MVKIFLGSTQIGGGGEGGTEVIANPEEVPADAPMLAAITIDGVVFKLPNVNQTLLIDQTNLIQED